MTNEKRRVSADNHIALAVAGFEAAADHQNPHYRSSIAGDVWEIGAYIRKTRFAMGMPAGIYKSRGNRYRAEWADGTKRMFNASYEGDATLITVTP